MGQTDKISKRQLTVLIFLCLLSPMIRILPVASVMFAENAAWLSPAAALIPASIFVALFRWFGKKAAPGEGLSQLIIKSVGNIGGRAVCVILALWLTFYSGFVARSAAERLLSSTYPNGNSVPLVIVTLLAAIIAGSGKAKSLARTAEVFLPIIIAVILIVSFAAIADIEVQNLLPISYLDAGSIALGALPIFNVMSIFVFFLFLSGYVEPQSGKKPRRFPWLIFLAIAATLVIVTTLGTLSEELAVRQQNSFFMMIRNIKLFNILTRFEAVVIALWIITDFSLMAALFIIVSEIWRSIFATKKRKLYVYPTAVLSAVAAFGIASSAFTLLRWSTVIVPAANLVLTTVLVPLVLLIGKARKKI